MGKIKWGILLVVLMLMLSATSFAEKFSYSLKPNINNVVGLDFPTYGWATKNARNEVIGFKGFNLGLGYSQKNYFQPYEVNKFNTFWGWGTVAVIFPYLTVGGDYAIPMDNNATLNLSAGLILAVFVPSPYVGVSYCW